MYEFFHVIRALEINGEAPGLGKIVVPGRGNERPGQRPERRRLVTDGTRTSGADEIPAYVETCAAPRLGGDSALPHTINRLIAPGGSKRRRAPEERHFRLGQVTFVGEPAKHRESAIERVGYVERIRVYVVVKRSVSQAPVVQDHSVFKRQAFCWTKAQDNAAVQIRMRTYARIRSGVGHALDIAPHAKNPALLIEYA